MTTPRSGRKSLAYDLAAPVPLARRHGHHRVKERRQQALAAAGM